VYHESVMVHGERIQKYPYKLLTINYRLAYSLIELLVVMSIIAILVAVASVSYTQVQKTGRNAKRASQIHLIATALESYYADHGFYPSTRICTSTTDPLCSPTGIG